MRYSIVFVSALTVTSCIAAPIQPRGVLNSLFNKTESALSTFEHTHLGPLLEGSKTSVKDGFHARDILSTESVMKGLASSYTGIGLEPPLNIYERGLLGDLFNTTKSVVEGTAGLGIGGELLNVAKYLAPDILDLTRRDEYSSRPSGRDNILPLSLSEDHPGIESDVETKLHGLLNSLKQYLDSGSPSGRDISERGILGNLLNSTKSVAENELGSGTTSKLLDGAKAISPDLIDLARRGEYQSRFSRRSMTPSLHESLSDIDDSVKEKLHALVDSLKQHLHPNMSQAHASESRSISSAFKAADDTLKPFGTTLTGIVNSASNGAASKAGSGLVTESESLLHHFFNRTAISNSIVMQGKSLPSRPDDPFSEYRRSVSSLFPAAASASKKVGVDLDDIANSALKGAKTTATNGLLSEGESFVKGLFNRTITM